MAAIAKKWVDVIQLLVGRKCGLVVMILNLWLVLGQGRILSPLAKLSVDIQAALVARV